MSQPRILFLTLLIAASCRDAQTSTTTLTSGEPARTSSEVRIAAAIAAARCDGDDATCASSYASRDACIDAERRLQGADLDLHFCPRGIDDADVSECLTAVRHLPCGRRAREVVPCRSEWLCPPWPDEGRP
jgi:hypothetical protein